VLTLDMDKKPLWVRVALFLVCLGVAVVTVVQMVLRLARDVFLGKK
jgi:hypothetical protein